MAQSYTLHPLFCQGKKTCRREWLLLYPEGVKGKSVSKKVWWARGKTPLGERDVIPRFFPGRYLFFGLQPFLASPITAYNTVWLMKA